MNNKEGCTGVVIMSYGSATTAEHVADYLEHIYHKAAPKEVVEDFENRYRLVGHSPLIEITTQQAKLLQEKLGSGYIVRSGMRHSAAFIEEAVRECREAGATKLIGIILSPQFSSFIMEGYRTALEGTAKKVGFTDMGVTIADAWPTEKNFIALLSSRIEESLVALHEQYGRNIPVIFTTHSLPQRVVEKDPGYLAQLQSTIDTVRARLPQQIEWYAAYQSAGHTPEQWLKPDLVDVLSQVGKKGAPAVLIVPIQFLSDHLEILYDLDIAAKAQCDEYHIAYHRIELPNTNPLFIETLDSVVHRTEGQNTQE